MSRSDREQREAEREARRARRLADRAEQRAKRKAEQARVAAERARSLADRVSTGNRAAGRSGVVRDSRQSPRERNLDRSIEDFVDEVTEKFSRKAEAWMDEQSRKLFDEKADHNSEAAMNAEMSAEMDALLDEEFETGVGSDQEAVTAREVADEAKRRADAAEARARKLRKRPSTRRAFKRDHHEDTSGSHEMGTGWGRRRRRRRGSRNLYRNTRNKKIHGVCSGIADYWGCQAWQIRMVAIAGIFFLPTVTIPAYFIAYFLMDEKPYYRQVTDRFDELDNELVQPIRKNRMSKDKNRPVTATEPKISNVRALKQVKDKFSDIEVQLRLMESHVTSPRFELQRELKKIAGED